MDGWYGAAAAATSLFQTFVKQFLSSQTIIVVDIVRSFVDIVDNGWMS